MLGWFPEVLIPLSPEMPSVRMPPPAVHSHAPCHQHLCPVPQADPLELGSSCQKRGLLDLPPALGSQGLLEMKGDGTPVGLSLVCWRPFLPVSEVTPSALGLFPWQSAVLSLTCGEEDRQELCWALNMPPRLSILLTRPVIHKSAARRWLPEIIFMATCCRV